MAWAEGRVKRCRRTLGGA